MCDFQVRGIIQELSDEHERVKAECQLAQIANDKEKSLKLRIQSSAINWAKDICFKHLENRDV